jgi:hypothetical protein
MILASEVPIWPSWHALRPLGARQKDASTWARTRDLSVNSRALCQLSHGGISEDAIRPERSRGGGGRRAGQQKESFCRDLNPDRWIQSPE